MTEMHPLPILLEEGMYLALGPIRREAGQSRRTAEVHTTRQLLTRSLLALGLGDEARIKHTASGAPILVGSQEELSLSISHCEDWVALLLGHKERSLGIDIEPRARQVERVEYKFALETESALLNQLGSQRLLGLQLLWSAKEALYKCLQPSSYSLLGFELSKMDISPSQGKPESFFPIGNAEYTAKMSFLYLEGEENAQELRVEGLAFADHVLCYTYTQEEEI